MYSSRHTKVNAPVAKCLLMVVLLGLCKCYEEFGLDLLHLKSALR